MPLQAVQRLDTLLSSSSLAAGGTGGTAGEAAAAAGAALLRRLLDDCPAVALAALGAASLLRLPPAAVMDGLEACFDRAMAQVGWGGSGGCWPRWLL